MNDGGGLILFCVWLEEEVGMASSFILKHEYQQIGLYSFAEWHWMSKHRDWRCWPWQGISSQYQTTSSWDGQLCVCSLLDPIPKSSSSSCLDLS